MALRTKIEPIADWVSITVNEALSPEAKQKSIAAFARDRLKEAQTKNAQALGRVPPYETFVDGRPGAALETVRPKGGTIVFEFELFGDVLTWILQALRERSPKRSGKYRDSHLVFADGVEIVPGGDVPTATEYSFTNTVPYARKIEIGKTQAGRDFVIQVPNRIYERTAKDARARFGNIAKIEFTFRGIVGGQQIDPIKAGASTLKRGRGGRFSASGGIRAHNKSNVRYPTIIVRPN